MEEGELIKEEGEITFMFEVPKVQAQKFNSYPCDQCYFKSFRFESLKKHKVKAHNMIVSCKKCNFHSSKWSSIKNHNFRGHTFLKCSLCDYTASRKDSLKGHIRFKHDKILFDCDICDYKANWKRQLVFHKRSVHENIIFKCIKCNYENLNKWHLKQHVKSEHEGFQYKCEKCEIVYKQQSILNNHKCSNGSIYKCDQCSYRTFRKHRIQQHKKFAFKWVKGEKVSMHTPQQMLGNNDIKIEN